MAWEMPGAFVPDPNNRRIVCSAVLYKDGTMLVGPRHFDSVMRSQYKHFGIKDSESESQQGFLDQYGAFLTREEAYVVAKRQSQIIRRCGGDDGKLFSENLY